MHTSSPEHPEFPRTHCSPSPRCGVGVWVLPVQRDMHPGPLLLQPLRPALLRGGLKSSDNISTEPDSSRLFSTSHAAQRGTHFVPIKPTGKPAPHNDFFCSWPSVPGPGQKTGGDRGDAEVGGESPLLVGTPKNKPCQIPAGSGSAAAASLPPLCLQHRLTAPSCVNSPHPNANAHVLGRCPLEIRVTSSGRNDASSPLGNTELSSCQKSPGEPASKCTRHQEKM